VHRPSDRGDIVASMPARVIEADKLAGFLRNGLNTNELSDLCDTLDLAVSGTKADRTERVPVGPMEREQQAAFREIEKVVRDLGIEMVHVATQ
jgi:hypothetical protein